MQTWGLLSNHYFTFNHPKSEDHLKIFINSVRTSREERNMCRVLVGNPEGKRPLGRPRRRWEDEIRMDLREIGWGV
jgi:hypothetical protein